MNDKSLKNKINENTKELVYSFLNYSNDISELIEIANMITRYYSVLAKISTISKSNLPPKWKVMFMEWVNYADSINMLDYSENVLLYHIAVMESEHS